MAKPTVDTAWATDQVAYEVQDADNNTALVLNRLEPTNQYKAFGVKPNVPIIGGSLNYKLYADHRMIEWLRSEEVGTILEFENGTMDLAQILVDRGGTWVDLGTVARGYSGGSVTVRGFQKTA